jgi:hypothetical protein
MKQVVSATGGGLVLNTLLPGVQAQLDESHQAAVTSAWSFMRSFGSIWGVAIPAAVFNNRFSSLLSERVTDPQVRAFFDGGNNAYEHAYADFIWKFSPESRDQIVSVYSSALQLMWQISIAFSGVNFLITIFERQVPLRNELETEYGLEETEEKKKKVNVGGRTDAVATDVDAYDNAKLENGSMNVPVASRLIRKEETVGIRG